MPSAPARWRRGGRPPPRLLQRVVLVAAFSAAPLVLLIILQHHHGPKSPNPSSASLARDFSDELPEVSTPIERDPEVQEAASVGDGASCATVERMGEEAAGAGRGSSEQASLRVREMIWRHFELHGAVAEVDSAGNIVLFLVTLRSLMFTSSVDVPGAERVRTLPSHEFCKQGFVLGKASEAGFGNEMYKILTAGALSVMLNRSLIIGQTRLKALGSMKLHYSFLIIAKHKHAETEVCSAMIRGLYPFGKYISYTTKSFTIHEIKHLWRKHRCARTYGRDLNMRVDIFENPFETNVLCSDWNSWQDPIIWFDGTTDAVGIQFFLKNVHPRMRAAASALFGSTDSLHARPNTFGELMRAIISPSSIIQAAVNWALKGVDPDIVLHMRMMANRPLRARKAAVHCVKRAIQICCMKGTPRVALVSDTPAFVKDIKSNITEFAEVLYFDYKVFAKTSGLEIVGNDKTAGCPRPPSRESSHIRLRSHRLQANTKEDFGPSLSGEDARHKNVLYILLNLVTKEAETDLFLCKHLDFRSRDWGSAPRWVAFVDFFLAARSRYAVVTGAHRRVGTTYAQLIAALAAANRHGKEHSGDNFTFLSSVHSNLLVDGLSTQVGWGHIWNRYAGPLSCQGQPHQCALTPLLPPSWWDGRWQSPIPRDVRRLQEYGVRLSDNGEVDEMRLMAYCRLRKDHVKRYHVLPSYKNSTRL
ncbi:hypothetical protein U9M48_002751 [Paspalum notatum var. saurae]|uniref:Uncharacterized protein n=1 Tax=Paspalum notatum var. saurae TaxID=547442 RepID=A0AAQ3PLM1_PASNO